MRFAWKVFFSVMLVIVIAFSVSSYILTMSAFETALNQEKQKAVNRIRVLAVLIERMASEYSLTSDESELIPIMEEATGDFQSTYLYSSGGKRIYPAVSIYDGGHADTLLLESAAQGISHRISRNTAAVGNDGKIANAYRMEIMMPVQLGVRTGYLFMVSDISVPFALSEDMMRTSIIVLLSAVAVVGIVLLFICTLLTRPIHNLSVVTRQFAEGDYTKRIVVRTQDEIGNLSEDFNRMADSLEVHIRRLSEEAKQREDFVASFAHELKTPLTSIIGYADMLRSQQMDEERRVYSANFIFTEGRRLERLSLKLLELIVLNRQEFDRYAVETGDLAVRLEEAAGKALLGKYGVTLTVALQAAAIYAEPDLLQTMLINLIDNGAKASRAGQTVSVSGSCALTGYLISVKDEGTGIPGEELSRITEAFYMVDKSRSGAHEGVGLGLALSAAIAKLHGAKLEFESEAGKGTTVTILLPYEWEADNAPQSCTFE